MLSEIRHEFRKLKAQSEKAFAQLTDDQFFARPGELVNPVALIVKHLAGNLASRWTDFLTTDGEKPWRDRDGEFLIKDGDTRQTLLADWERGFAILFATLDRLNESDLDKTITIRSEPMPAKLAILRSLTHVAYHVGQIAYLKRLLAPKSEWLTIAPGKSKEHVAAYTKKPEDETRSANQ
jgi:hypothetical protein